MEKHSLLDASSRIALAAYLHDLGKFAERAAIDEGKVKNAQGVEAREVAKQEYCPNFKGRYSHVHAAYTALAMDVIEKHLPDLKVDDCFPFASWRAGNMGADTDSMVNGAARHHKPETFLQWVIACADRLASGFERNQFEEYNRAEEETKDKRSYLTARMEVLLEKIGLDGSVPSTRYRYPLQPLSAAALIPVAREKAEPANNDGGRQEYGKLWQDFLAALKREDGEDAIPQSHKRELALWLDHFDSLWLTFTHCIPSATAAKVEGKFIDIPAEVSLYDHAKTTATLATALWRWHQYHQQTGDEARQAIQSGSDYAVKKFLLIQGDMFGIQNFIFQTGGSSNKYSSKLLRGRSFYVSLMTECAALRILDGLGLPPTSQIINAAGKFLIVAPNTPDTLQTLKELREQFDQWSIDKTQGRIGVGLAWTTASPNDFITQNGGQPAFEQLLSDLFDELEVQKFQRLQLWQASRPAVMSQYLDEFAGGAVCEIDGVSPASSSREGIALGQLAQDQITIGNALAKLDRLIITRQKLNSPHALQGDILGLHICFTPNEDISGRFASEVQSGNLLRCWSFSLPLPDGNRPFWNGYARRYINGYVARLDDIDLYSTGGKYKQFEQELDCIESKGEVKTFNHLACEDRLPRDQSLCIIDDPSAAVSWVGVPALHAFKGDIDDLGAIFQKGYERPNFAKMAALSRQVNAFFAVYLPWLCAAEFKQTYTVFAGGDDFFLLGPWHSQMRLAQRMSEEFARYVANNPQIHFSAGLYLTKPGLPIRQLADGAEHALEKAKGFSSNAKIKNAVHCFGTTLDWPTFAELLGDSKWLDQIQQEYELSTGFIYGLLELAEMADKSNANDPQKAIWRSFLSYRTARWVNDKRRPLPGELNDTHRERLKQEAMELTCKLAERFGKHGKDYHLPLSTHLYTYRD